MSGFQSEKEEILPEGLRDPIKVMERIRSFRSESERQEAEWATRYYVVRQGWKWHVKCGSGTRSLASFFRKRKAQRVAGELLTAFRDGMFVVTSKLRGGGRYA